MQIRYSIYTLVDPRDGAVRYVGLSQSPQQRYSFHCHSSTPASSAYEWLQELKELGLKPLLFVVEKGLDVNIAWKREAYWMIFFFKEGEPLLNYIAPKRRREVKCQDCASKN